MDSACEYPVPPWHPEIWRGGYPGLLELPDDLVQRHFRSYVQTCIERDVRTVAGVGDLQQFGRFFGLLAASSAREVNPTQLGRDLGMDRKTAIAWKSTAAAIYQWLEVPAFTRNATKRVSGKHKGYMTDSGLVCYHQRISSAEGIAGHPMQGQLVETWTVGEVVKGMRSFRDSFCNEHVARGLVVSAAEEPEWVSEDALAVPWWSL